MRLKSKFHTLVSTAFAVVMLAAATVAMGQTPADWKKLKGDITMYMANDLGRNGYYDQKPIAELMGRMGETLKPKCVIAAGDVHHFNGIQSVNDPLWMTNYELIYSHPQLMINWFPVCGNHEYRGNTQAVISLLYIPLFVKEIKKFSSVYSFNISNLLFILFVFIIEFYIIVKII